MRLWKNHKEVGLLSLTITAFMLLVFVKFRLPLIADLKGLWIGHLLTTEAFGEVLGDLLIGLISAYVFYILIDLWPRKKRERSTLRTLNLVLATVVDAYERARAYGHEPPISVIDPSILTLERLSQNIEMVKSPEELLSGLKFAMETAHSRYSDFQGTLVLAAELSPEHALAWLGITDKIRLLAIEFETYPKHPWPRNLDYMPCLDDVVDNQTGFEYERYQEYLAALEASRQTLQLRLMEFFEQARAWVSTTNSQS